MKTCLFALRTARTAGAERICLDIAKRLKHAFAIEIASLSNDDPGWGEGFPIKGANAIFFGRYDVINTHLFLPGLIIRLRRRFDRGFIWIHTVHYCGYQGQNFKWLKRLLDQKFIFCGADRLVAVSPSVKEFLRDQKHVTLVRNAVPIIERRAPGNPIGENLQIGTIAMLRGEKGLAELLRVMQELVKIVPGAHLKVAGDGPLKNSLSDLVAAHGLSRNVTLLGYVTDIESFLSSLDIYFNSSHTESFGLAVFEALQFSLPVISTDVGAMPEVLAGGKFGQLVSPPKHPEFVAEAIRAIKAVISDPLEWQRRARAGLEFHRRKLDAAEMARLYRELFEKEIRPGICMISPIVTHATGGLQKQLQLQSKQLTELGYKIFVLQRFDEKLSEQSSEWAHVEFLSAPNPWPRFAPDSRLVNLLRGALFLVTAIWLVGRHRRRISIIHAHQLYSPTLIGVACRYFFKIGLVVKVTASGVLGELRELKRLPFFRLRRRAFRAVDQLVVLSSEMKAEMLELFPESKINQIPNSVKIPVEFNPLSPREKNEPFRILYCGRLSREKSLETLIRAAGLVEAAGFSCRVDLVGGTYGGRDVTTALKSLAQEYPALPVTFHGPQRDVTHFYLAADAFVLPSASEGMSNALLEALSFGVPCVVSDIVPNKAIIEDRVNGLTFRQGDAADLAGKLTVLARDRRNTGNLNSQLGAEGRNTVKNHFSTEAICGRLSELYAVVMRREGEYSL